MKQTHIEAFEEAFGKILVKLCGGSEFCFFVFGNKRTNYVALLTVTKMLFDISVGSFAYFGIDKICFNLLPALGKFIEDAQVKVAVDYKSKSSRYGGC